MTRRTRLTLGGALLVVAAAVALPAAVMAGPDGSADVQFGTPDVGSPFPVGPPPIVIHDASPNAQFNLVPRTVVVAAGGTVTFTVGVAGPTSPQTVPHQVAVCKLGVGLDDVNVPASGTFINDRVNCPVLGRRRRRRPSRSSSPGRGSRSLGGTWSCATSGRTH